MSISRRALLAAGVLLAGCGDSGTEPDTRPPGTLSFSYSAPGFTGTIEATGTPRFEGGDIAIVEFAFAIRDLPVAGEVVPLLISAGKPTSILRGHYFEIDLPQRRTGTFTLGPDCDVSDNPTATCALAFLALSLTGVDGENARFTSGTVEITSLTDERMAGTFSGIVEIGLFDPVSGQRGGSITATVQNGTFELPIWDQDDLRDAGAGFGRVGSTPVTGM